MLVSVSEMTQKYAVRDKVILMETLITYTKFDSRLDTIIHRCLDAYSLVSNGRLYSRLLYFSVTKLNSLDDKETAGMEQSFARSRWF